jgi:hypothetical protein
MGARRNVAISSHCGRNIAMRIAATVILAMVPGTSSAHTGQGNATPSNMGGSHGWETDLCTESLDQWPGAFDFRHACIHHDGCLTGFPRSGVPTYWTSKAQCDTWFRADLKATCRELHPSGPQPTLVAVARDICQQMANTYYIAVDAFSSYKGPPPSGGWSEIPAPATHAPVQPLPGPPFQPQTPLQPIPAPTPVPQPPPAPTFSETTGGVTNTWTNYTNAGGYQGQTIPARTTVQIVCKLPGFAVANGNTWWYRIASTPWNNAYHASADAFYNNGQTSGPLAGTPYVDGNVRDC